MERAAPDFGLLHTTKILRPSNDLPVVIEIVDTGDKIEAFLEFADEAIGDGLATVERVEICITGVKDRTPDPGARTVACHPQP